MSKKKYPRKRKQQSPLVPIGVGIFLIVLAILFMAAPKSTGNAESLSAVVPATVNYAAPELSLQNINGETKSLTDYRDQVVLVNNWATWCPPCKAEMPEIVAFYNDHTSDGLMVVAIEAGEPKESVQPFVDQYQMSFAVWLDPDGLS